MIVLNKTAEPEMKSELKAETSKFYDMFCKEIDAYCAYKEWAEVSDDRILVRGLWEIMEDEYLHAKFLREYMMELDLYDPYINNEYDRKFMKMHKSYFD